MIENEKRSFKPLFPSVKKRCDGTPTQKRKKCWKKYQQLKKHTRTNVQMKHQR